MFELTAPAFTQAWSLLYAQYGFVNEVPYCYFVFSSWQHRFSRVLRPLAIFFSFSQRLGGLCVDVVMQSSGLISVNITGTGTSTLKDVRTCAEELKQYVRNPKIWLGSGYKFTNFLDPNMPSFKNLSGCAPYFMSSSDRQPTLYGAGWKCPESTGAVVGAASPQVFTSFSTTLVVIIALSFISQLVLTTRRHL